MGITYFPRQMLQSLPTVGGITSRLPFISCLCASGSYASDTASVYFCLSVLSEAANGSQIFLSESTFLAVQHMTEELGCVTHEGMDHKKLHSSISPWLTLLQG